MVARAAAAGHEVSGTSSATLDVRSRDAVIAHIRTVRPTVVINTASRIGDWQSTAVGPGHVAVAAAAAGARLIHMSTDAVHWGRPSPYTEEDEPSPIHLYGSAKAAAEVAVAAVLPSASIVRTSLIVGTDDSQHVRMSLDMITGRRPGRLFTDEIRCPVHVTDLADALLELAETDHSGVLNVAGPVAISRAEFGVLVAQRHGLDPSAVPIGSLAGAGLGPRPAEIRLDSSLARRLLKTRLRPVTE